MMMEDDKPSTPPTRPAAIWVDADACPVAVRTILNNAARRTGIDLTYVANQPITAPRRSNIRTIQVARGFDVADNEIVRRVVSGDLVITADIPLAAEVIEKGAAALSGRGEWFDPDTVRQKLGMRDFMDTLRASGVQTGGPSPLGVREKQSFANALDRWLQRRR